MLCQWMPPARLRFRLMQLAFLPRVLTFVRVLRALMLHLPWHHCNGLLQALAAMLLLVVDLVLVGGLMRPRIHSWLVHLVHTRPRRAFLGLFRRRLERMLIIPAFLALRAHFLLIGMAYMGLFPHHHLPLARPFRQPGLLWILLQLALKLLETCYLPLWRNLH